MRIVTVFQKHPETVGETYFEHMCSALGFTAMMARAAVCCCIHAFLPFLFQTTGSTAVEDLHRRMIQQRARERCRSSRWTGGARVPAEDSRSAA